MGNARITVGDTEILALSDAYIERTTDWVFPTVPVDAWEPYRGLLTEDGNIHMNVAAYIVRSSHSVILIDAGLGEGPLEAYWGQKGQLLTQMHGHGISPDEIDLVAFTHLHGDHIGWNFRRINGESCLTFPRAKYVIQQAEWDYYTDPQQLEKSEVLRDNVLPLKDSDHLELVDGESALSDHVTMVPTQGHSPGHVSMFVDSAGQHAVVWGDLMAHEVQVSEPRWHLAYDRNKEQACQTRADLLDRIEAEGMLVAACHLPAPGLGRIARLDGRRYWQALP